MQQSAGEHRHHRRRPLRQVLAHLYQRGNGNQADEQRAGPHGRELVQRAPPVAGARRAEQRRNLRCGNQNAQPDHEARDHRVGKEAQCAAHAKHAKGDLDGAGHHQAKHDHTEHARTLRRAGVGQYGVCKRERNDAGHQHRDGGPGAADLARRAADHDQAGDERRDQAGEHAVPHVTRAEGRKGQHRRGDRVRQPYDRTCQAAAKIPGKMGETRAPPSRSHAKDALRTPEAHSGGATLTSPARPALSIARCTSPDFFASSTKAATY